MHGDVDPRPFAERVERRHEPRRAADVDRAWAEWAQRVITRRVKQLSTVGACCTLIGGGLSTLGWRFYGPPQELAAFTEKQRVTDSAFAARLARAESDLAADRTMIDSTNRKVDRANYLICWTSERPGVRVPGCKAILERGLP